MFRNLQFQKYVNSTKDIYFYLLTLWVYHDQPRRYDNHNKWRSFISLLGKTKTKNLRKLFRNRGWIQNNFYCIKAFWSYKPSSVTKWIRFTQLFCFLSNIIVKSNQKQYNKVERTLSFCGVCIMSLIVLQVFRGKWHEKPTSSNLEKR